MSYYHDEEQIISGIVPQMNVEKIILTDGSGGIDAAIIDVYVLEKIRTFMRAPMEEGTPQGGPQHAANIGSWYNISTYGEYFNIYAIQSSKLDSDIKDLLAPRNNRLSNIDIDLHGSILEALSSYQFTGHPDVAFDVQALSLREDVLSVSRHAANEHFDRVKFQFRFDFPRTTEELNYYFFLHFDMPAWLRDNDWNLDQGAIASYIHGIGGLLQFVPTLENNSILEVVPVLIDENGIPWYGDFHRDEARDGIFTGAEPNPQSPGIPLSIRTVRNNIVVDNRSRDIAEQLYHGDLEYKTSMNYRREDTGWAGPDLELVGGLGVPSGQHILGLVNSYISATMIKKSKHYANLITRLMREQYPLRFGMDFYDDSMEHLVDPWDIDGTINNNLMDQLAEDPSVGNEPVKTNVELNEGREGQVNIIFNIDMVDFLIKKSVLANFFPLIQFEDAFFEGPLESLRDILEENETLQEYFAKRLRIIFIKVYRHKVGGLPADREPPECIAIGHTDPVDGLVRNAEGQYGSISEVPIQFNGVNPRKIIKSFAVTDWSMSQKSSGKYYYRIEMEVQDPVLEYFKRELKMLVVYKNILGSLYEHLNTFAYIMPEQKEYDPFKGSKSEEFHFRETDATGRGEGTSRGFLQGTPNGVYTGVDLNMLRLLESGAPGDGIPAWNIRLGSYAGDLQEAGFDRNSDPGQSPRAFLRAAFDRLMVNYSFLMISDFGPGRQQWEEFGIFYSRMMQYFRGIDPWQSGTLYGFQGFIKLFEELISHYQSIFGFSDGHKSLDTQTLSSCGKSKIMSILKFSKTLHQNIFDADAISSFRSLYIDIPQVYDTTLVPIIGQAQLSGFVQENQAPKYLRAVDLSRFDLPANGAEDFFTYYTPYIYSWRRTKKRSSPGSFLRQTRFQPDLVLVRFDADSLHPEILYRIERYLDYTFDTVANQKMKYSASAQKSINSVSIPRLPDRYTEFDEARLENNQQRQDEVARLNQLHTTVRNYASLNHLKNLGLANISFYHRSSPISRWDRVKYPLEILAPEQLEQALFPVDFQPGPELDQLIAMADLMLPGAPSSNRVSVLDQILFASSIQRRTALISHMNDVVEDSYINKLHGASVASKTDTDSGPNFEGYVDVKRNDIARDFPIQESDPESYVNLPFQIKLSLDEADDVATSAGIFRPSTSDFLMEDHSFLRRSRYALESLMELQIKINLNTGAESWVTANGEIINSLRPDRVYLCRLKYYTNRKYGFGHNSVKAATQVVDRVFLLNQNGGVEYQIRGRLRMFAGEQDNPDQDEDSPMGGSPVGTGWHDWGAPQDDIGLSPGTFYGAEGHISEVDVDALLHAHSSENPPIGLEINDPAEELERNLPVEADVNRDNENKC